MTTRAHFAFRVDRWDQLGDTLLEHVAGIEDFQVAQATFEAACKRWPGETSSVELWLPGAERQTRHAGGVRAPSHETTIDGFRGSTCALRTAFPHSFSLIARPCSPWRLRVRRSAFRAPWWSRAQFDARPLN